MGETLTAVFIIFLAVTLMFVYPMESISNRNDDIAQQAVEVIVTEYVNGVAVSGIMDKAGYEQLESKLEATGNTYDIEVEIRISDKNPGKKEDNQKIGDTTYYSLYTSQVESQLDTIGSINLKQGDFIKVSIKNTNTTISQMFKGILYGLTGNEAYVISAQYSSSVLATGNI